MIARPRVFLGIDFRWYWECSQCGTWPVQDQHALDSLNHPEPFAVARRFLFWCPICYSRPIEERSTT